MFFSSFGDTCLQEKSIDKKENKMYKKYEMELAGRTLRVDVDRVAKQANGAVLMHYGDTTVLCTATASDKPREGIDFFPLSVEYNERMYSVGKIPGGFNKREGKASENAILTDRVIDRPMRPLFPKDYRNDVTLENLVMSVDQDCSPEHSEIAREHLLRQAFPISRLTARSPRHRSDLLTESLYSIRLLPRERFQNLLLQLLLQRKRSS